MGRNLWTICKTFNVLPNDPLIQKMTYAQREFIIQSMLLDMKEAELASKGLKPGEEEEYMDSNYDDVYNGVGIYSNNLVEPGDDPDDLYRQVVEQTEDKSYDKNLDTRIKDKVQEKEDQLKNIENMQDERIKKLGIDKLLK